MPTINETQQLFDQSSALLLQSNNLHMKLCRLECKREDEGQEFCWRLSHIIDRAHARCTRRFTTTMAQADQLINTLRPCAAACNQSDNQKKN